MVAHYIPFTEKTSGYVIEVFSKESVIKNQQMQYRFFKGIQISEVGLDTWQLGNANWGRVKDNEAVAILQALSSEEGNFIHT